MICLFQRRISRPSQNLGKGLLYYRGHVLSIYEYICVANGLSFGLFGHLRQMIIRSMNSWPT